jgi:hypothetical protein
VVALKFEEFKLKDLVVNPENDRHGDQGSEQEAINWLFEHHSDKMLTLMTDIVEQGQIFDAPLVLKRFGLNLVHDGNRRVTCLKILAGLCDAPTEYRLKIEQLRLNSRWISDSPIICQIEDDQSIVDQIVSRRHNGTDGGRGQLRWDTRAKANHANRVGGTNQYPIAEAVENFLAAEGFPKAREIGRSTLFRLLNAKKRQRQFGIALGPNGELLLQREKDEVLAALSKVADDILDKELTLKNVLNLSGVSEYMGKLLNEGLIVAETPHSAPQPKKHSKIFEKSAPAKRDTPTKKLKNTRREKLIPHLPQAILWPSKLAKAERIWGELQFVLVLDRAEIAVSVMFRTLIEQLVNYAIQQLQLKPRKDHLHSKALLVVQEFYSQKQLTLKQQRDLERVFTDTRAQRSLEALHRVVHSEHFTLSPTDLLALWTSLESFLLLCIDAAEHNQLVERD